MSASGFIDRFTASLNEADLVTFDVFDTALVRGVERPEDVFLQLAHAALARGLLSGELCSPEDLARARRDVEREARRDAWEREGRGEIRLDEIYGRLGRRFDLEPTSLDRLMRLENEIEIAQNARNPYVGMLYDLALRAGKMTGFVSDMYLDDALVRHMLQRSGYAGFAFVHVSSASFETKAHGSLYRRILIERGVSPARWLHVGDNRDSDVGVPAAFGIRAMHYEKCATRFMSDSVVNRRLVVRPPRVRTASETRLFCSISAGLIASRAYCNPDRANNGSNGDFWTEWGYRHLGPLLAGFGTWLVRELHKLRATRAYFLARDGYLIKSAVDRILAGSVEGGDIATNYLYASRRAYNFASITRLDDDSIEFLLGGASRLTPRQYLARIDVDVDLHVAELLQSGLTSVDKPVVGTRERRCLRELFRLLEPRIVTQAQSEFATLKCYFGQSSVINQDHVVVVDLGWHGSLQQAVGKLIGRMGSTARTSGFYLGTFAPAKRLADAGMAMKGYLCENGTPARMDRAIKLSVEIIEWMFSAPHGSLRRFVETPGGVSPLLAQFEFEPGRWERAEAVQQGALEFLDDYLAKWHGLDLPEVLPRDAIRPLVQALRRPSLGEAHALGDLKHAEGFGHVASARHIARPAGSLADPLSYPRLLLGYRECFWRPGYARRVLGQGRRS